MANSGGLLLRNYVAGRFVETATRFPDINPVDGCVHAEVCEADRSLVDRAVEAGRTALKGDWGRLGVDARIGLLRAVAERMEARFDEFVAAEVADTGKPRAIASALDVPRGIANFRIFADLLRAANGESFETETPDGRGALNYTIRKPLGVVGVVSPWNLPLLLLTWKVAPALAAGNAVVAKPSEETPATATLLSQVMDDAGVPTGAFNLVHGFGPDSAGQFLTGHPGIDAITFTGESATGSAIMRAAAPTVKSLSFELGGKNAAVIFADADFDAAVDGTARAVFANCGQVCLCTERVYVERSLFERFVMALKEKAQALVLDVPANPRTTMGPLISRAHREKVVGYYDLARSDGANVITGGGIPTFGDRRDGGSYVEPTILTGLPETARCVKEEIFGPVCHVQPFDHEDEAIALANDSLYGLAAALWTQNLSRAHRLARQLEAGIIWVNCWFLRDLRTPFGGVRLSGIGREGGLHSLNFYSEPTNICVKL
jgi:aminomuconate-semialdehyde/2-hydroxymuconate-6-semialdehyde dehydrogenase